MYLDRRQVLKLTGATAAVSMGGMAGCLDDVTGGDGDTPDYARWVAWDEDEVSSIYIDLQGLDELDEFEEEADPEMGEEDDLLEHEDPMLAVPAGGLFAAAFVVGFGLMGTGLGEFVDFEGDDDEDEFETEIDELLFANDALLLLGDVDTDEVDETLTEPTEDEFGFGDPAVYEQTDEIGDFVVYELADDDDDDDDDTIGGGMEQDSAIAVSDEAIIVGDGDEDRDAIDVLRLPIEAENGDGERAIDAEEDFEWLLSTAGHGHVAFGGYGELEDEDDAEEIEPDEEDELDVFEGASGLVASMTVESETNWSADMAVSGVELDDDARSQVEDEFGASASDVTHDFDGDRVTISANWDEDPTE